MKPTIASTATNAIRTEGRDGHREVCEDAGRPGVSRRVRGRAAGRLATGPGTDEALTLEVAARDYVWLYDYRHGIGYREIAARDGVGIRQVQRGVERARALEKNSSKDDLIEDLKPGRTGDPGFRLIPLFPIGAFTPETPCPHHGSIGRGSRLCCMVCHASGMDDHPGLRRDPEADPAPEPEPAPASDCAEPSRPERSRETRKQRRRRLFAEAAAVA
jgi:hypothetical protein